jgi:hypothetical protein
MLIHQALQEQMARHRTTLWVPSGAMCVEIASEDGVGGDNTRPVCPIGWPYHVTPLECIVDVDQGYLPLALSMHV